MTAHRRPLLPLLAITLFLGAALAGCLTQDAPAEGELYVKDDITDDASAVYITFNKAEVLPAHSRAWITVFEGEETFEMLSLSGPDAKGRLASFSLSPGEYLQLRIIVTNVTVVDHGGNATEYVTFGNAVTIGHNFTVQAGRGFELLVDFDMDAGVGLAGEEYVPVIGFAQTTHYAANGSVAESHRNDRPNQTNSVDHRGLFGICTAWENSAEARTHGNATNATAFRWLSEQAAAANQTEDGFCADVARPGAPERLYHVLPENMPEQAQAALADRRLGAPDDAGPDGTPGQPGGSGAGPPGGAGNQTGSGQQGGGPPQ